MLFPEGLPISRRTYAVLLTIERQPMCALMIPLVMLTVGHSRAQDSQASVTLAGRTSNILAPNFIKAAASSSSNDAEACSSSLSALLALGPGNDDTAVAFSECVLEARFTGDFRRGASSRRCSDCSVAAGALCAAGTSDGGVGGAL